MVGIDSPPEWEHERGYRLNADSKPIVYRHEDGSKIFIEYIVNDNASEEDENDAEQDYGFWGLLTDSEGTELEGPVHFTVGGYTNPKEEAISWMEETMREFA